MPKIPAQLQKQDFVTINAGGPLGDTGCEIFIREAHGLLPSTHAGGQPMGEDREHQAASLYGTKTSTKNFLSPYGIHGAPQRREYGENVRAGSPTGIPSYRWGHAPQKQVA